MKTILIKCMSSSARSVIKDKRETVSYVIPYVRVGMCMLQMLHMHTTPANGLFLSYPAVFKLECCIAQNNLTNAKTLEFGICPKFVNYIHTYMYVHQWIYSVQIIKQNLFAAANRFRREKKKHYCQIKRTRYLDSFRYLYAIYAIFYFILTFCL